MPMRLSGLVSNMDTDSIIKELMKAERMKSTKLENKKTKLEWTQDIWKDLNKKVYSFYTSSLSKIKLQGTFYTKSTFSSNSAKVDVKADSTAAIGNHQVQVKQIASAQFITSNILEKDQNLKDVTQNTKLTDLGFDATEGTSIKIDCNGKTTSLDIGISTTIADFTKTCNAAGLNASYDSVQNRFFISSKDSGIKNAFTITTESTEYAQDRNNIRDFINYGAMNATQKSIIDSALTQYIKPELLPEDRTALRNKMLATTQEQVRTDFIKTYINNPDNIAAATDSERTRLEATLGPDETLDSKVLQAAVKKKLSTDAATAATTAYNAWKDGSASEPNVFLAAETGLDSLLADYYNNTGTVIDQTNSLSYLGLSEITKATNPDGTVSVTADPGIKVINPTDAIINYNGIEITNSSNSIKVNGLTIDVKAVTIGADTPDPSDDEVINLTVSNNNQGVYDTIKGFVKSYNDLIQEMNDNYYADLAKGYEPLTDEQKESMSDAQIEKWEDKIKKSLLRRDDSLSSILSTMKTAMAGSVEIDGKNYALSSFGINTTDYTEKGLLHIKGDADEPYSAGTENKLMKALTENPEKVQEVLTSITSKLYETMTKQMKSSTLNSALTFYNDKEMKKTMDDYNKSLKIMEDKLTEKENRYYKQFSAMETAMAKLNSQSSSLMSMLGTN